MLVRRLEPWRANIGKRLVRKLLARRGAVVHFLIRPESQDKVATLHEYWGVDGMVLMVIAIAISSAVFSYQRAKAHSHK